MSRILVINLRRNGDIFQMSHFLSSLKNRYPKSEIHLLIYSEFKSATSILNNINHIHKIDRKKILTYYKNKLFSNAFTLREFNEDLKKIRITNWDRVINYSNDHISTLLVSSLNANFKDGIYIDENHTIKYSSEWSIYLNDIIPSYKYSPISLVQTHLGVLDLEMEYFSEKIKLNPEYNQIAFSNFTKIRKKHNIPPECKFIGIQLLSSSREKDIPPNTLVDFIQLIYRSTKFFPILLIAPYENERAYANSIAKELENDPIIVEATFEALPSVIMNLDCIVTPDTSVKHLADLTDSMIIEVSTSKYTPVMYGPTRPGSLMLSHQESMEKIKAMDIFYVLNDVFSDDKLDYHFSAGITLYQMLADELGPFYKILNGQFNSQTALSILLSREFFRVYYLTHDSTYISEKNLSIIHPKVIKSWCNHQKNVSHECLKTLLSCLRVTRQMSKSNILSPNEFITKLSELLDYAESNMLIAIPVISFRAKVDSLDNNERTNLKRVETLLFTLKADIQIILNIIERTLRVIDVHKNLEIVNENRRNRETQQEN
ncbi:MAG: glycosyltransferase family 9 protein [Halobacteriovoraceae bacterium]|nr:glycosyltransferase family 9 protein [Halobacteriovoraceae bacterium]